MFTYDENTFSDLYKDTHGFRPRNHEFFEADTTPERKQKIWDATCEAFGHEQDAEKARHDANIAAYEAALECLMGVGAKNRAEAQRWYLDSLGLTEYDLKYGAGYICFQLDLPYSFEYEFMDYVEAARKAAWVE